MIEFTKNADGTIIGTLSEDVMFEGFPCSRISIPKIKGKHLKKCPIVVGVDGKVDIGQFVTFAALVVEPTGIVDELDPSDAMAVAGEVGAQLQAGK